MKIDRLLTILTILLQTEQMTAPKLAAQLEVTRRTISRDIEDLCKAGFPIITKQGAGGGISIAEGYKLDKSILTKDELQTIITGLKSIGSIGHDTNITSLLNKLTPSNDIVSLNDNFIIDLGSQYKDSISVKTNLFRTAIRDKKLVQFDYYSYKGMEARTVEPYFIVFKWSSWYLFAYCLSSEDYRMFKFNRLWNSSLSEIDYKVRVIPEETLDFDEVFPDAIPMTVLFDASVEYQLIESYGPDSYTKTSDGTLLFQRGYTNKDYMISWLLSFGDKAKVIEPEEFITEIKTLSKNLLKLYDQT